MVKKGKVAEIFSKALHHDNPESYQIGYIDLGTTKETTLAEFFKMSENFEVIPASRIVYIKKGSEMVYSKNRRSENTKNDAST
jgi:uncharacterized protein (UPF0248 family)